MKSGNSSAWLAASRHAFLMLAMVGSATCASGCGDSTPTEQAAAVAEEGPDLGYTTAFVPDTGSSTPDTAGGSSADIAVQEIAPTDGTPQTGGACEFPKDPASGEPGATCATGGDCDSGWCVAGPDGKVCSKTCSGCCPTGFACEATGPGSGDTSYICQPKLNALCRPCMADSECAALSAGALCVSYGGSGRFCGGTCTADADCFADHACLEVEGTQGAGKQCVRQVGECSCSAKSTTDGATTLCSVSSDSGSCKGQRKCGAAGLSACDAPEPTAETCNGLDDDCDGLTDEAGALGCNTYYLDEDGDSAGLASDPGLCLCQPEGKSTASAAGDCNDKSPAVWPGAKEVCNGIDDDCDGLTDPGEPDLDGDTIPDCIDTDIDGDGTPNATDCAPANMAISPTATEVCNGADDNCDGVVDEPGALGCLDYYGDADQDGYGKPVSAGGIKVCQCGPTVAASSLNDLDCNDSSADVYGGANEVCDGKDNDCSGQTDQGCDDDGDGFCDAKMTVVGSPAVCSLGVKDCNDDNAAVAPNQKETCGNQIDDDCDGTTDVGAEGANCVPYFKDADLDGFGAGVAQCLCGPTGQFTASNNKDCDDTNYLISPAKLEVCGNGVDDDCNGVQDEEDAVGCKVWFTDPDGDGYGLSDHLCLCAKTELYKVDKGGDCKPSDPEINPGAEEICNAKDDNCQNGADEAGAKGCTTFYADKDGDGIGDASLLKCLCAPSGEYSATAPGDCDDTKSAVKPGAMEVCDGLDNDCNGKTDELGADGCKLWYVDLDNDGYGTLASGACLCAQSPPFNTQKGGDCNDDNNQVHPQTTEFCDGIDNNCNGSIDEENAIGCSKYMMDQDKDDYGVSGLNKCLCKEAYPFTATQGGDCDDNAAAISPKAAETCDTVDNNCDGLTDPAGADGCSAFYMDKDQDGYGTVLAAPKCLCEATAPYATAVAGDCNDGDKTIYPGASEYCDNKDTNCDGTIDPVGAAGCVNYYVDLDNDGWGGNMISQCLCGAAAPFSTTKNGDCNDQSGTINPGAAEICNAVDDNCNGVTDDVSSGTKQYWLDGDSDGYGAGNPVSLCGPTGQYTALQGGDCNDGDKSVHPGATEVQCNKVDEDCSGADLCTVCQPTVLESFDSGSNGWSLGIGWTIASWAGKSGGSGLAYGDGVSSYPTSASPGLASKALFIPPGTTKLQFYYFYSPDIGEYGSFDEFTIAVNGAPQVSRTAGDGLTKGWILQTLTGVPPSWQGQKVTFSVSVWTKDSAYNTGPGFAIDGITALCN